MRQAEALAGRLREAGVAVDLVIRKGVGQDVYLGHEDNKVVVDWLDKRLNQRQSEGKQRAGATVDYPSCEIVGLLL